MKLDGFGWRSNEYREALAAARQATRPAYQYDYVCQRMQITPTDLPTFAAVTALMWRCLPPGGGAREAVGERSDGLALRGA